MWHDSIKDTFLISEEYCMGICVNDSRSCLLKPLA